MDIVGYSKLLADERREVVQELNQIVRETEQFRAAEAAGKLTRLPTGDGMLLVFTAGGNGQNTRWLAGQGHSVTLLDSNPVMLDQAKEGLADERLLERCQLGRSKQVKVLLPKLKLINEKAGCHPARRKQAQSWRCR